MSLERLENMLFLKITTMKFKNSTCTRGRLSKSNGASPIVLAALVLAWGKSAN